MNANSFLPEKERPNIHDIRLRRQLLLDSRIFFNLSNTGKYIYSKPLQHILVQLY